MSINSTGILRLKTSSRTGQPVFKKGDTFYSVVYAVIMKTDKYGQVRRKMIMKIDKRGQVRRMRDDSHECEFGRCYHYSVDFDDRSFETYQSESRMVHPNEVEEKEDDGSDSRNYN